MALAILVPLAVAATSPLLQWRQPVYVAAGFAGVVGLGLMLLQPLLAGGAMPGVNWRSLHRALGALLVAAVVVHVAGLWITSPPDVVDALLLRSPTPFSVWGVLAMWAVLAAALLAGLRRRVRPWLWRRLHSGLVVVAAGGTVAHALLIQGAMGTASKALLCALVLAATGWAVWRRGAWRVRRARAG